MNLVDVTPAPRVTRGGNGGKERAQPVVAAAPQQVVVGSQTNPKEETVVQ
jgi:hypothetical protein